VHPTTRQRKGVKERRFQRQKPLLIYLLTCRKEQTDGLYRVRQYRRRGSLKYNWAKGRKARQARSRSQLEKSRTPVKESISGGTPEKICPVGHEDERESRDKVDNGAVVRQEENERRK